MIRDRARQIYTGAGENEGARADECLRDYIRDNYAGRAVPMPRHIARELAEPRPGTIYFITCDPEGFPIKIGYTTDLQYRMTQLQTALPYEIRILGTTPGTPERDRDIRTGFGHIWMRGDWFRRELELLEYIRDARCGGHTMTGSIQEQTQQNAIENVRRC